MSESAQLVITDKRGHREAIEPVSAATTPMQMLAIAVQQGAAIEKLQQLMALQERWEANEARKAFVAAMAAFKTHAIQVTRDKVNSQFSSRYVSLGNLVNTVTPFLSKHGLSVRWDIDQSAGIKVACVITHEQGHSESVSMIVPPDTSGVSHKTGESTKNPIQQIKSAITYAKACTFESICGLASTDSNLDDDGNGTTYGELIEQIEWIQNACDLPELQKLYLAALKTAKNGAAIAAITDAKDKRKAELQ